MAEATADQSAVNARSRCRRSQLLVAGVFVFAAALLSGCGSSDQVDDPSGGATTTSRVSVASCVGDAAVKKDADQFVPPELARRLPPALPGSRICRIDPRTGGTIYALIRAERGREILEYYGPGLRANGCETDAIGPTGSYLAIAGQLGLEFSCPQGSGTVVVPESGNHFLIAWDD